LAAKGKETIFPNRNVIYSLKTFASIYPACDEQFEVICLKYFFKTLLIFQNVLTLCWLILGVSLSGLKDIQIDGKTCLSLFLRMFQKRLEFESMD
jgi:hypothetical protein